MSYMIVTTISSINKSVMPVKILLVELTVPWDSSQNFQAALDRKTARYKRLTEGYDARNLPMEIGCKGVVNQRNAANLEYICNLVGIRGIIKLKGERIDLIGFFRIWLSRYSQKWSARELIIVIFFMRKIAEVMRKIAEVMCKIAEVMRKVAEVMWRLCIFHRTQVSLVRSLGPDVRPSKTFSRLN